MGDRGPTLRDRLVTRITDRQDDVFLTREFRDLAGERQVLRALHQLVDAGILIRLGYGVYGRAEISSLTGQPMLAASGGFLGAARQALDKLGVRWDLTGFQKAYNDGTSTQVPVNPAVRVANSRITRKIRHQGHELIMERR